jgi:ATP-binding cassette subfamily C protein CydC
MNGAARSLREAARAGATERRQLGASVLFGFGALACATALMVCSGYLISRASQRPEILELSTVIVAVRALAIARSLLRYGERLSSHDAALRLLGRTRALFYRRLAPLVPGDLGGPRSGDLLSRFVGDVDTLQDLYLRALAPPVAAALTICAASVAAWAFLPAAGPVVFVSLLLAATVVPALAALLSHSAGTRQAPARAALSSELVETIEGAPELVLAGRAAERIERLRAADARVARIARRDALAAGATTALGSLAAGLAVVAVLLVVIPAVHDGALAGVLAASLAFLVLASFESVAPLQLAARRLSACAAAARRLAELTARRPSVTDPVAPRPLPAAGDLRLDAVSARYGPDEPWVLRHASLLLRPGMHVALQGASGAGKTTLAQLLVRFRDPDAGAVTIGGVALRDLSQDDVRAAVVLAAQDAHLFDTTLRENLLIARREASDAELFAALADAGAETWARGLPAGLDTMLGEAGALVSGGERQRVALARALLTGARFLILDEPTAHLDHETADAVMRTIAQADGGRGVLVITHGDTGLEYFDEVRSVRDGAIV